jgi:hypothetical protein
MDASFTSAVTDSTPDMNSTADVSLYMPGAKLEQGNFLYVYNDGVRNWYGLSGVAGVSSGIISSWTTVTVLQALKIDSKIDDGFPATGNVVARYLTQPRGRSLTHQDRCCHNFARFPTNSSQSSDIYQWVVQNNHSS